MTDREPGHVWPLRPDGTIDTEAAAAEAPKRRSRPMVIGGVVVGVVAVAAIGAVIAWRSLVGSAFASAEAVPIDADIVVTFDLLQVRDSERVDRLIKAFTVPAAQQGLIDDADIDVLDGIDQGLEEEIGMTLSNDVVPWIGRSVSLAIWFDDLSLSDLDQPEPPEDAVGGVLVAGVRNEEAAAAFVDDLTSAVAEDTGWLIERSELDGGTLSSVTGEDPDLGLFVFFDGDTMILGAREVDIRRALDARDGESIADKAEYERLISELPSDRVVAMYMDPQWIADLYDDPMLLELGFPIDMVQDSLDAVGGIAGAMTLRDEGVSFDLVYAVGDGVDAPGSLDASGLELLERLPDDTLVHFASPIEAGAMAEAIDPLRDFDPDLYDSLAAEAEEFLGVDLFGEVLPALGREVVFAVVPTPEGLFADEFGVGVGAVLAIGVVDHGPVASAVTALEDYAIENGVEIVTSGSVSSITDGRTNIFAYALSDDTLAVGTGPTIVDAAINGVSPSVVENPQYQHLDRALPGSGVPVFVDIQGIFDLAEFEGDDRAVYNALQAVGASGQVDGDLVRMSLLIAIDY